MMKKYLNLFLWISTISSFVMPVFAQPGNPNILKQKIRTYQQKANYLTDTAYLSAINQLGFIYADNYPDSAITLLNGQAEHCKSVGFLKGEFTAYKILGNAYQTKGSFAKSLQYYQTSNQLAKKNGFISALPGIQNNIGLVYSEQGNYSPALRVFYGALKVAEANHDQFVTGSILDNIATIHFFQNKMAAAESDYRQMLAISKKTADTIGIIIAYNNIGEIELEVHKPREALATLNIARRLADIIKDPEMLTGNSRTLGDVYFQLDSLSLAEAQFNRSVLLAKQQGNSIAAGKALVGLAKVQNKQGIFKQALSNGLEGLQFGEKMGQIALLRDANEIVSAVYANMGDGTNALVHYKKYKTFSDSIRNIESERMALAFNADYNFSKKELEYQRKTLQQQWLIFSALAALITLCVIVWLINLNRKKLDHANKILQHKNEVIANEKATTEQALYQLQDTQVQLIQSEKMASLGELTAGIAHEIQNPLNFVNNFSGVSIELLKELIESFNAGDKEEVLAIAGDLTQNLGRIQDHGNRADSIVKSMMEHSRIGTGKKELTDLTKLVNEFLKLTYNGLQAKYKSFNVELITHFAENLPLVNIIPQDIGRVIHNLFSNAFYAIQQKTKTAGNDYRPVLEVTIAQKGNHVELRIKDNGIGIPDDIKDKIMQPFFTTKPTGEGVGLGLSLSYDIIVKGHNGHITANTFQGLVTELVVTLPVN
jgi:two-component system NtrC family sensor kinase